MCTIEFGTDILDIADVIINNSENTICKKLNDNFKMPTFVAIDFETATSTRDSACAVGIITVENGEIVEEYQSLIKPPNNEYNWHNTNVHGITASDTRNAPTFAKVYAEIKKRLANKTVVAHNESFDRSVLKKSMEASRLNYSELNLEDRWECTMKIYKAKGYSSSALDYCSRKHNIQLNHHDALSDARACAKLFILEKM